MDDLDRSLAHKARRGDRRAMGLLYQRYRGRVFGFLAKEMGDRATAEDVFQEAWVKVLQAVGTYDPGRGPFRAWLFRIATNAAVDRRRRDGVRRTDELDAPERMPSNVPDPERRSASRETGRMLTRELSRLDPRQRTAILLRHQQGLSYVEISRAMEVPEGTAKTLVHRGVAALRAAIRRRGEMP
jgi:RNA polymerase sigma-70 factor (ECF subfamily)